MGDEGGQRGAHVHSAAAPPVLGVLEDLQVLLGVRLGCYVPISWGWKDDIMNANIYKETTTVTDSN